MVRIPTSPLEGCRLRICAACILIKKFEIYILSVIIYIIHNGKEVG